MSVAAIVVAAGPGTRLGAGTPKGFVRLGGEALVVHGLRAILTAPMIDQAIVVVPPQAMEDARALLAEGGPYRLTPLIVAGGTERRDSVRNGIAAVGDTAFVAIHDAARPFVTRTVIEAVIDAARRHGAAIAAVPSTDTVKLVSPDGIIEGTPVRARTWLAQTPQVFRTDLIRAAHAHAAGSAATDDAMLIEQLGHRVHVVAGDAGNRKITTPDDLQWAEWQWQRSTAPR